MNSQKFNKLLQNLKYDKKALTLIYEEYYPKLVFHLTRRFGDQISPEDAAQDVFLTLMTAEDFNPVEFPVTWLCRTADNKVIDMLKSQHPESPLYDSYPDTFNWDRIIMKDDMKRCFQLLDETSRRILYLYHWEGFDHREIAKQLDMSCANVRTKACRAYKVIKKCFSQS